MCRMLITIGSPKNMEVIREKLIDCMVKSAERDPYGGSALKGGGFISHGDGWGYASVSLYSDGGIRISVVKSLKPIYRDQSYVSILKNMDTHSLKAVAEMIHARLAGRNMPVNIHSTHPAEAVSRSGYRILIIHNGTVDKDKLLKELNIDKNSKYAKMHSDTHVLAQYLADIDIENLTQETAENMAKYLKTALNIGIILIKDSEIQILVGSLYKVRRDVDMDKLSKYYRIYRYSVNDKLAIYASSTIEYYCRNIDLDIKWSTMDNGQFDLYRLNPNKEPHINKYKTFKIKIQQDSTLNQKEI